MPDVAALPAGLTAQPLRPEDMAAVAALLTAAEPVDDTGEHEDADDLAEWLVNDLVDLSEDSRAVWTADGVLAGWATAIAPRTFRDAFTVRLEGRVHPEWRGRGIGRALLAWQAQRGAQQHAQQHPEAPGQLSVAAHATMPSLEDLLERAGFEPVRWFFTMERPLTDLPAPTVPEGVDVVPFEADRDEEVRRTHNAAFFEHFGSTELDPAMWRTWVTGQRAFRPELSRLAVADGAVVGYALAYVYESDTRATGARQVLLGQVGVLRHVRGRGVATALIAASLQAAAGDCVTAGLDVDSDNTTGALGLYEGLGFRRRRTHVRWSRPLPPVGR